MADPRAEILAANQPQDPTLKNSVFAKHLVPVRTALEGLPSRVQPSGANVPHQSALTSRSRHSPF